MKIRPMEAELFHANG